MTLDNQIQGTVQDCATTASSTARADFDFASRLMEEEGIFYYFTHSDGSHKMVLADTQASFADVPGPTTLVYETIEGGTRTDDRVHRWEKSQVHPLRQVSPLGLLLRAARHEPRGRQADRWSSVAVGTVTHKLKLGANCEPRDLRLPGPLRPAVRRRAMAAATGRRRQNISSDSTRTVGIRMEEEDGRLAARGGRRAPADSSSPGTSSPSTRHFDGNGDYVLTGVQHLASAGDAYTTGDEDSPRRIPTRSSASPPPCRSGRQRTTPAPRSTGRRRPSSSGNSGDEIFTDKYGRVKVQFPWDRRARTTPTARAGSASRPPGPARSGASSTSPASARRWSSPSRKATPTGRSSSAASTTSTRCPPTRSPTT